jgi:hypothetical protein
MHVSTTSNTTGIHNPVKEEIHEQDREIHELLFAPNLRYIVSIQINPSQTVQAHPTAQTKPFKNYSLET